MEREKLEQRQKFAKLRPTVGSAPVVLSSRVLPGSSVE